MIITPFANMATPSGGGSIDPDAQTYITQVENTGVDLSSIADDISDFYAGLKTDGLYSKMAWMYPFLGGTADAHAIEGINPTSADTGLTWFGTVGHTSAGLDFTGGNGYGLPNISPADVHSSVNDVTIGGYVSTAVTGDSGALIGNGVGNTSRYQLTVPFSSNDVGAMIGENISPGYDNTVAPVGRWMASRSSQTLLTLYKNGSSVSTQTGDNNSGVLNTNPFAIGYFRFEAFYFNGVTGFVFGASGFDATEAANFDSRLATFMTAVGR